MNNFRGTCTRCGLAHSDINHTCTEDNIYLIETDWMVNRHRDQLELGIETSLTDAEYIQLLSDRQSARNRIAPQV